MTLDSAGVAGPSPVQALAFALAGCMAMDLAHILSKGRYPYPRVALAPRGEARGRRSASHPCRVRCISPSKGDVPTTAIERAIALSREKYCSVWHSMRQDIEFTVTWTIGS